MSAAFWHRLPEEMATASKNDSVFRLDWMMLIPDGPGKFKLTSGSGSSVQQQAGEVAGCRIGRSLKRWMTSKACRLPIGDRVRNS